MPRPEAHFHVSSSLVGQKKRGEKKRNRQQGGVDMMEEAKKDEGQRTAGHNDSFRQTASELVS